MQIQKCLLSFALLFKFTETNENKKPCNSNSKPSIFSRGFWSSLEYRLKQTKSMQYVLTFNDMTQAIVTNPSLIAQILQGEQTAKERVAAAIAQLEKERGVKYPN